LGKKLNDSRFLGWRQDAIVSMSLSVVTVNCSGPEPLSEGIDDDTGHELHRKLYGDMGGISDERLVVCPEREIGGVRFSE
jgi:hypothetical protein